MNQSIARREFLAQASVVATGLVLPTGLPTGLLAADKKMLFWKRQHCCASGPA